MQIVATRTTITTNPCLKAPFGIILAAALLQAVISVFRFESDDRTRAHVCGVGAPMDVMQVLPEISGFRPVAVQ